MTMVENIQENGNERYINISMRSGSQALCRSQEAHGCLAAAGASGVGGWKNSIATVSLLIDGDIVGKTSQEIQLALDPAEDLLGGHKHLKISEANYWRLARVDGIQMQETHEDSRQG